MKKVLLAMAAVAMIFSSCSSDNEGVSVFFVRIEAGAITVVTEIAMTYDQGAGVTLVQVFE